MRVDSHLWVLEEANSLEKFLVMLLSLSFFHLLPLDCFDALVLLRHICREHDLLALLYLIKAERAVISHLLVLSMVVYEELEVAGHEVQLALDLGLELADEHFRIDLHDLEHLLAVAELLEVTNLYPHSRIQLNPIIY